MSNADLKFFVGGIPSDVKHRDLYEFFRTYGVVKRVTIFNSDKGRKLFGFCFVKFKKIFGDKLDTRQTFIFQGRKLEVDPIVKRSGLKQSVNDKHARRIFLQNLPSNLDKDQVMKIFSRYGEIVNCFVINREQDDLYDNESRYIARSDPKSANYGYVIFRTKEQAESLVRQRFIELKNKQRIYIKKYCSTINREVSEDKVSVRRDQKSVSLNAPLKKSGTKISAEKLNRANFEALLIHYIKPTSRGYGGKCASTLNLTCTSNLRFNISLETLL